MHFGARNDSPVFLNHFKRFFDSQFFPFVEAHGISNIFILGDILDRRKYININTANFVRRQILEKLSRYNVYILAGNHDVYHTNTLAINSLDEIIDHRRGTYKFTIITEPMELKFTWGKTLWLPWICDDNRDKSIALIKSTNAEIALGHLQLKGFEMHKGHVCESGIDVELFSKFKSVITGHFHHRSSRHNIHYLGAPYEITWADYDDPRGFHIFDTDTYELRFIPNPNAIFWKLVYDDRTFDTLKEALDWDFGAFKDCYIKVIVQSKNKNPYWFDQFITHLDKEAEDVKIIETSHQILTDINIDEKVENTPAILKKYAEETDLPGDKQKLVDLLIDLHSEALALE